LDEFIHSGGKMRKGLFFARCLTPLLVSFHLFAQVHFEPVSSETVQARLGLYKGNDQVREAALFKTFADAGCPAPNLSEQPVSKHKEPNVVCVLPGETAEEVVVGAHFDHVPEGSGVVDNWSGASLLPSLFQSLLGSKHKHTFVFIGFTGEESGEIGSTFYVKHLSKSEVNEIALMITLDSIGLGPTKVWVSRSDKHAVAILNATAHAMNLPLAAVNVDGFGESDEEPFIQRNVKTITIHSVTSQNSQVLHSRLDAPTAISFPDYYDTYRLLAGYLAVLDSQLGAEAPVSSAQPN
jgi:Peptidase family M28